MQESDAKSSLVPSTLTLDDHTLTALTNKYNDLQIERQRLLRNARPDNPLITGLNEQLAGLKGSIKESLNNVKKGLVLERNSLLSRTSKYQTDIKKVPALERGLLERNRAQSVKENLFHYLLQKREETALSLSSTVPNSQVIDKPAYQSTPVRPRTSLIYLCALMAGFIMPICAISLNDIVNAKVQEVSDVKAIEGLRILGELSRKEKNEPLIIQKDSRTTISELFRYIRMNLNFLNKTNSSQVLLITSGMKGEGKTFFSLNLAMSMAFIHKKVVLLEFDLRKPDLLDYIGLNQNLGLSDYLNSDTMDIDSIIVDSALSAQLSVIGCGTFPTTPSELLMSYKIPGLFEELRKRYDYIIVDTSPVGQVADAFSLAAFTDASIYLVRYNFTNLRQLDVLKDIVENEKLKNVQVVLNDARRRNGNAYGYGRYRYESKKDSKKLLIS
jgi:capsular exopolysaccharide synthesis family protein